MSHMFDTEGMYVSINFCITLCCAPNNHGLIEQSNMHLIMSNILHLQYVVNYNTIASEIYKILSLLWFLLPLFFCQRRD